ncbi:hypothetical protein X011_11930 [Mycobacterium tuberculosis variant microti OV254]|nr:hypothetical protein X011_11930 [Mycobacterium tuberculosis variant microti OV254]
MGAADRRRSDFAIRLCAQFVAGQEAVTHDIEPFMASMGTEGRLGDEIYLTQFAFEEVFDPSPTAQVRASATYNHVVEGMMALTGYHSWHRICNGHTPTGRRSKRG